MLLVALFVGVLGVALYSILTSVQQPADTLSSAALEQSPQRNVQIASPLDIGGGGMIPKAVMQWMDYAIRYAQRYSILDPEEILAIIWNESTGNPKAQNPGDPSWGLMGVTFGIGKAYAGIETPTSLFDPETNIKAGAAYLAYLKDKFSGEFTDWPDSYNVGETKFGKGIRSAGPGNYSRSFFSHLADLRGGTQ